MDEPPARLHIGVAMDARWPARLFGPDLADLQGVALPPVVDWASADPAELAELQVLITGWGAPHIGESELDDMPRLQAVLHAAGTVKGHLSRAVWERGVLVTSAADANAVPVAEFTLAMILLAGKGVPELAAAYKRDPLADPAERVDIGNAGRRIGVVGASRIGRRVVELLAPFDFDVLVHDPIADLSDLCNRRARATGLEELFSQADVVTLHAPLLPATDGLVSEHLIGALRPGSTLINTARGALVDEDALVARLRRGDLVAVLDVTREEPLPLDSPLRGLPNVVLTPHVPGAQGLEVRRLGAAVVDELRRLSAGTPARSPVELAALDFMA